MAKTAMTAVGAANPSVNVAQPETKPAARPNPSRTKT